MMPRLAPRTEPRFRRLGTIAFAITYAMLRFAGACAGFRAPHDFRARRLVASLRAKLERGETAWLVGIGPGGHNAGVGLIEVSQARGIRLVANHEEERFRAIKHFQRYPSQSVDVLATQLARLQIDPTRIHVACASWDYPHWAAKAIECVVQELPGSWRLLTREASPHMNASCAVEAFKAPRRLGHRLRADRRRMPVVNLRHHDNHAWFSWGVSPFARCAEAVLVLVIDGAGDDGAISAYVAEHGALRRVFRNDNIWDSLGMMYGILSSSQGGWPLMSSEGRYMGAAAWGDANRAGNRYYRALREVFVLADDGRVLLNRSLANWHRGGCSAPYTRELAAILGPPIPPEDMWHPDAVLDVADVRHAPITKERVDKAAAVQLVFEDALFHIVEHLVRTTRSTRLVLTGGTALNCVANMRLLERFDPDWYARHLGIQDARLHLWVPPVPGDSGASIGAAYHFACLAGARPGESLQHAFYCGLPFARDEIERSCRQANDIGFAYLGNVNDPGERERIADRLAFAISQDAVIGLAQGPAETGPRALGHRSILANPANPATRDTLNGRVKFRELVRPLAPMATIEAAQALFDLAPGASDDDYNAYNYMVLTARAKPAARALVPAVVHEDGTSRVQIVREKTDPFVHAYLRAMGRHVGAEASVNTSLNVGAPIAQTPAQALQTLKRSAGMHGLLLIAECGATFAAWHRSEVAPKDDGRALRRWMCGVHAAARDVLRTSD